MIPVTQYSFFFFFNDTATTEIYTLSLHDALPISIGGEAKRQAEYQATINNLLDQGKNSQDAIAVAQSLYRSEEHTSELQSLRHLVCRLLLEKKKKKNILFPGRSVRH